MLTPKTSTLVLLAAFGALAGTVALADKGGMKGPGDGRGAMMLGMFDTLDTDKSGTLSLAELEAHRKAEFATADTNGDGTLSAEELSAQALARFQERQAERTQAMLDNLDNDGNGSLSEDELGAGPGERHFARIDTDNDGAISKAEAEAGMKHRMKHGHGGGMGDN